MRHVHRFGHSTRQQEIVEVRPLIGFCNCNLANPPNFAGLVLKNSLRSLAYFSLLPRFQHKCYLCSNHLGSPWPIKTASFGVKDVWWSCLAPPYIAQLLPLSWLRCCPGAKTRFNGSRPRSEKNHGQQWHATHYYHHFTVSGCFRYSKSLHSKRPALQDAINTLRARLPSLFSAISPQWHPWFSGHTTSRAIWLKACLWHICQQAVPESLTLQASPWWPSIEAHIQGTTTNLRQTGRHVFKLEFQLLHLLLIESFVRNETLDGISTTGPQSFKRLPQA